MKRLKMFDLAHRRVLVTRESARSLAPAIAAALSQGQPPLELDFDGVAGLTPSFLDELLGVITELLAQERAPRVEVVVLKPPTRLSSKFAAIGRGRDLSITEGPDGSWVVARARQ